MTVSDILERLKGIFPGSSVVVQMPMSGDYITITGAQLYGDKFDGDHVPEDGEDDCEYDDCGQPMLADTVVLRLE